MKTKLVKRHFCDFCNKGGMVAASMAQHEKTCLRNPERGCFLCKEGRQEPAPMKEMIDAFFNGTGVHMAAVRALCGGCPACILATILQAKKDARWIEEAWVEGDPTPEHHLFDYKKEKDEWYAEQVYYLNALADQEH